jgi:hypothetical protein
MGNAASLRRCLYPNTDFGWWDYTTWFLGGLVKIGMKIKEPTLN